MLTNALKYMDLGSGIRKKPIPDSGSRSQKGTGSRIRNTAWCWWGRRGSTPGCWWRWYAASRSPNIRLHQQAHLVLARCRIWGSGSAVTEMLESDH